MQQGTKPKRWLRRLVIAAGCVALFWTVLTLWVDLSGPGSTWTVGDSGAQRTALVIFDPDPIYNLDERVCRAFAEGLAADGFHATVATVAAEETTKDRSFDLYVFCANTYNWRPDRAISNYIEAHPGLEGEAVVAITLGSGSTEASQQMLEGLIAAKKARLVGSRSFWLLRPNDEARMEERNVDVAVAMAREWGGSVGKQIDPPGTGRR